MFHLQIYFIKVILVLLIKLILILLILTYFMFIVFIIIKIILSFIILTVISILKQLTIINYLAINLKLDIEEVNFIIMELIQMQYFELFIICHYNPFYNIIKNVRLKSEML